MGEGENKMGAGQEGVYRLGRKGNPLGRNCTDSLLIGEEGQSVGRSWEEGVSGDDGD